MSVNRTSPGRLSRSGSTALWIAAYLDVRAQVTLQHDPHFATARITSASAECLLKLRAVFQHRERLAHIRRAVVVAAVRETAPAKHAWVHSARCSPAVSTLKNRVAAGRYPRASDAAQNPAAARFAKVVFKFPCPFISHFFLRSYLRSNPSINPDCRDKAAPAGYVRR